MEKQEIRQSRDLRFLLRAAAAWMLSTMILLPLTAAIVTLSEVKASSFASIGAGVGFLASAAAGYAAQRKHTGKLWLTELATSLALTILLLTLGFVARQEDMSAEGVLLVAASSIFGCFFGGVLASRMKKLQKRKTHFSVKGKK